MSDLERLELILRRIIGRRKMANEKENAPLNLDTQELLQEMADEIAISTRSPF
jgi:hypothetical protein